MKKIVSWYHIMKDMPLFSEAAPEEVKAEEPATEPEPVKAAEEPAKLAKKAKATPAKPVEETAAPKKAKKK